MNLLKTILSIIGVSLLLSISAQAETISPLEASEHIGSFLSVEGVVSQVSTSSGGTIFINFGGRYPNHAFYGIIFGGSSDRFPNVEALEGREVKLTGSIELYKGKPQIILVSPDQIELSE